MMNLGMLVPFSLFAFLWFSGLDHIFDVALVSAQEIFGLEDLLALIVDVGGFRGFNLNDMLWRLGVVWPASLFHLLIVYLVSFIFINVKIFIVIVFV